MMRPKKHPRPIHDFKVTSMEWELDIEHRHREAGFEPISREVIRRRFFQFANFLQTVGLTEKTIVTTLANLNDSQELRNSDLTDRGFYFVQRYHGRWLARIYKDRDPNKEQAFLEKWYRQFSTDEAES